jgi:DNA polymerase-3 subunit delta'
MCLPSGSKIDNHIDVHYIRRLVDEKTEKKKSTIAVDQIRILRKMLSKSSMFGGRKVAIIEDADRLNKESANALLKTLEEPLGNTVILLRSSSESNVLETIASRCQIIRLKYVPRKELSEALIARGCNLDEADDLARISSGCPGVAIGLMTDSEARANMQVAKGQLSELLTMPLGKRIYDIEKLLPKKEALRRESVLRMLNAWEWVIRDLLMNSVNHKDLVTHKSDDETLLNLSNKASTKDWANMLIRLRESRSALYSNVNSLLSIEHVLLTI